MQYAELENPKIRSEYFNGPFQVNPLHKINPDWIVSISTCFISIFARLHFIKVNFYSKNR